MDEREEGGEKHEAVSIIHILRLALNAVRYVDRHDHEAHKIQNSVNVNDHLAIGKKVQVVGRAYK